MEAFISSAERGGGGGHGEMIARVTPVPSNGMILPWELAASSAAELLAFLSNQSLLTAP